MDLKQNIWHIVHSNEAGDITTICGIDIDEARPYVITLEFFAQSRMDSRVKLCGGCGKTLQEMFNWTPIN